MIKEALEYLISLADPEILDGVSNKTFVKDGYQEVKLEYAKTLEVSSLQGIHDYLKANIDELNVKEVLVHVDSFDSVDVYSKLDSVYYKRDKYLSASFSDCELSSKFGQKMSPEEFSLFLQMYFEQTPDLDKLKKLSGTIGTQKAITSSDDGITQTVSVKEGAVLEKEAKAPNPVVLKPYRTFYEVEQPESPFVFRVHNNGPDRLPSLALYEADGGRWKRDAVKRCTAWLQESLKSLGEINIVS